jgi:DUF4097 and DUF4098 domain-containing protein YvlB
MRTARALALLFPVLLLTSAGCDIAMADHQAKEVMDLGKKTFQVQPGGRVEISNVNGRINVRPAEGNAVEITVQKVVRAGSSEAAKAAFDRIEIKEESSPTLVKFETKLQRSEGFMGRGPSLQVEYSLRVPPTVELHVSTVNGGVEIEGVGGKVNAEATNGGIRARDVGGAIQASTTNGGVEVDLLKVPEDGVKLECTNGGIKLRLPSDGKASISARITNGGIDTSGLTLDTVGEQNRRRLEGRLNGGGPRIELEGVNGGIRISSR